MKALLLLVYLVLAVCLVQGETPSAKPIEAPKKRPPWDQAEAVRRVKGVLELESSGKRPWDDIGWETDAKQAAERATQEKKPLFVFFFLKKNIGPADAPC
jgi:hypothetical protein